MPIDITGNIERFEVGDTRQFTHTATVTVPVTVAFVTFDPNGNSLALATVQAGATVSTSGNSSLGLFFFNYVLPNSRGYYTGEWTAWDTDSLPFITRFEFEMIHTRAESFISYGDIADVLRTARQMFGRADITQREIQDYMEPADDFINGKLGRVFTVPVSPTPPILRDMVKVFTLFGFYSDRYSIERENAPGAITERREQYATLLTDIQSGNCVLVVASGILQSPDPIIFSTTTGFKPIFDSRDWERQRIDPDLVERDKDLDK